MWNLSKQNKNVASASIFTLWEIKHSNGCKTSFINSKLK